jgi:hypothetical protein
MGKRTEEEKLAITTKTRILPEADKYRLSSIVLRPSPVTNPLGFLIALFLIEMIYCHYGKYN